MKCYSKNLLKTSIFKFHLYVVLISCKYHLIDKPGSGSSQGMQSMPRRIIFHPIFFNLGLRLITVLVYLIVIIAPARALGI